METDQLNIKNMVCGRCIKVVHDEMEKLDLPIKSVRLGIVEFQEPTEVDEIEIKNILEKEGFELIDDETTRLISKIKTQIIKHIHQSSPDNQPMNLSDYLEHEIGKSYSHLSTLFSKIEGRTIEKYSIQQRIERIKELLVYGEKTISEIAWELGYSSSQYLSNQFKSETGLTPSQFRTMIDKPRKALDEV